MCCLIEMEWIYTNYHRINKNYEKIQSEDQQKKKKNKWSKISEKKERILSDWRNQSFYDTIIQQ